LYEEYHRSRKGTVRASDVDTVFNRIYRAPANPKMRILDVPLSLVCTAKGASISQHLRGAAMLQMGVMTPSKKPCLQENTASP
jgi:hypothetical protein